MPGVFGRRYRALTAGVIIMVSAVAFESLGVATVLPVIARRLGGLGSYGWGLSALMLANIVGAVVAGRVADRRGPAAPFAAAIVVFVAGCLAAAASPVWAVFLLGRAVQGVGVGAIMSIAYLSIGATYPDHLQARMYALLSSAYTIPALVGPPVAGLVAGTIGWRWVFVLITPVAAAAGLLAAPALRRLVAPSAAPAPAPRDGTVAHTVLLVAGSAVLLLAFEAVSPYVLAGGVAIGLVVAAFGLRRVTPAGTLTVRRGAAAGIVVRALICGAYFGTEAFLPLGLAELRGVGTTMSGLGLAAGALTWVGGTFLHVRMDHGGTGDRARATALGAAILAVGVAGVAVAILVPAVPAPVAIIGWAVGGLGIGMAMNASTAETMRTATDADRGLVSSSLQLAQTLATAVLAGLGGGLIHLVTAYGGGTATALAATFGATAALAVACALVAGRLRTSRVTGRVEVSAR